MKQRNESGDITKKSKDEAASKLGGHKSNAEICAKYYRKYGEYRGKQGSLRDRMQSSGRARVLRGMPRGMLVSVSVSVFYLFIYLL